MGGNLLRTNPSLSVLYSVVLISRYDRIEWGLVGKAAGAGDREERRGC